MRTLQEILQDQKDQEFDAIELREVLTNPATKADMGTLEGWEF